MRLLRYSLFLALLVNVSCTSAHGQNSSNITDPFAALTYKDNAGSCVPQQADNAAANVAGCCAAPGRRGCSGSGTNGFALPACLSMDPALAFDAYNAGILCTLPTVGVDPVVPTLGQTGAEMTFYITSDIHFFRRTYNLTDQLTHVKVLNNFFSIGASWPTGTGIPVGTAIQKPLALLIDGDITTHGLAQDLGAFRINYERGTLPASIQYPVLFGIGNHETVSDETPENAKRMFDYLEARMANTHMDPSSGNYSWDWQGVHMVQMNTWAGDRTSVYPHASDGLTWLANDLKTYVGNTTKPVMLFEHYLLANVYPGRVADSTNDDFFPADANAIDSTGALTGQGYETFWKIIQNYNVIGLFGGHNHCLGMFNTMLSNLPVTGALYPSLKGYAMPMDNYDDGSGGDTGDGADNVAGVGNGCAATTINGKSVAQTAVASFLVTHVTPQYLDVSAVSWTGDGSAPYFDAAGGYPTGATACRKRINSQFVAAPSTVKITQTASGYAVASSADTPANIPVALKLNSRSGVTGFNFVDACADPTDAGTNNLYFLVNGEASVTANTNYTVAATRSSTATATAIAVLLTPLSGATPSAFAHTSATAPANDVVTVYGPPNTAFTSQVSYSGSTNNWLTASPASASFNAYGIATIALQFTTPPSGFGASSALIAITSTATGVVQTVTVTVTQPTLSLIASTASIYQGGTVTFNATLTPATSGTVINFENGTTTIGSATTNTSGIASFTYNANTIGTLSITSVVSGAVSPISPAVTLTVAAPISLAISPAQVTVLPGKSGSTTASITPFGGFTGMVTLSCTSPAIYVTCTLVSSSLALTGITTATTTVNLAVAATIATGRPALSGLTAASLAVLSLPGLVLMRRQKRAIRLLLLIVSLGLLGSAGCGGVTSPGASPSQPAPSGSQIVTITAMAGGVTSSAQVTIIFQ